MVADVRVKIPREKGKISRKKIKGTTYVYYLLDRTYDPKKQYSVPRSTTIGKVCPDDPSMMVPNDRYFIYVQKAPGAGEKETAHRSACLRIGSFKVLRKIIEDCKIDKVLDDLLGRDSDLFLDLVFFTLVTENSEGHFFPDYAYNHPLFADRMEIYSDQGVAGFNRKLENSQILAFFKWWNKNRDRNEKIYLSYHATNKNTHAGDVDFLEAQDAKNPDNRPVLNDFIAYGNDNSEPLFYEMLPGPIVDVPQVKSSLEKVAEYGYQNVGFILDRGSFTKESLAYMDQEGHDFLIMMEGRKKRTREIIEEHRGSFEESSRYSIRGHKVIGKTVKGKLFSSDQKDRYLHLYFNQHQHAVEREELEERIDRMSQFLKDQEGKSSFQCPSSLCHYFDPVYQTQGEEKIFVLARKKQEVIDREIKVCGTSVIITSKRMSAAEALDLVHRRDLSEKLFRGDRSDLGSTCLAESVSRKLFIEFVALLLWSRFYTRCKEEKTGIQSVSEALRELERIESIRQAGGQDGLVHEVSATQRKILRAFVITERDLQEEVLALNRKRT